MVVPGGRNPRRPQMSEEKHQPGRYEIRVRGRLPGRWGAWFAGMSLTY